MVTKQRQSPTSCSVESYLTSARSPVRVLLKTGWAIDEVAVISSHCANPATGRPVRFTVGFDSLMACPSPMSRKSIVFVPQYLHRGKLETVARAYSVGCEADTSLIVFELVESR